MINKSMGILSSNSTGSESAAHDSTSTGVSTDYGARLLLVVELVAQLGPITFNNLMQRSALPKSSLWRILQTLRSRGWVQARVSDGAFQVTKLLDSYFANGKIGRPEVVELGAILESFSGVREAAMAIGSLSANGRYEYLDWTRTWDASFADTSLVFGPGPKAALLGCSRRAVKRYYDQYVEIATPEEAKEITEGDLVSDLQKIACSGPIVWSHDELSFAVHWRFEAGTIGAIEFQVIRTSERLKASLKLRAQSAGEIALKRILERSSDPRTQHASPGMLYESLLAKNHELR